MRQNRRRRSLWCQTAAVLVGFGLNFIATGVQAAEPAQACEAELAIQAGPARPGGAEEERAAEHLFNFARLELAIGRTAEGCRMLALVASTFGGTAGGQAAVRALAGAGHGASRTERPAAGSASAALEWRETIVRATAAQDELRADVGDRVFFSAGSAELGSRGMEALNAQAGWLELHSHYDIVIEGHADDGGDDAQAAALGQARAVVVRQALVARGVDGDRISVLSLGTSEAIATCSEAECAAQNRRAVTRLVPSVGVRRGGDAIAGRL